jgi:hypothetical protein
MIKHLASKIPCDLKIQSQGDTEDRTCGKCSAVCISHPGIITPRGTLCERTSVAVSYLQYSVQKRLCEM